MATENNNNTSSFLSFIKRRNYQLWDDNPLSQTAVPFQFVSYNVPNLHVIEDGTWTVPTEFEQTDALTSIQQIGGRVVRIYTLSVQKQSELQDPSAPARHIVATSGTGTENVALTFNEPMMGALDRALAIAATYNVRVIIPFIDNWEWWGGVASFAALHGHTNPSDFYTSPAVRTSFKRLVGILLNRTNTVTGVQYRNDPTVFAWETGNELESSGQRVPASWTRDLAAHIKSVDSNHLVMDGSFGKHGWDQQVLDDPNVDILTNHYYPGLTLSSFSGGEYAGFSVLLLITVLAIIVGVLAMCFPKRLPWLRNRKVMSAEHSPLSGRKKPFRPPHLRLATILISLLFSLLPLGLLAYFIITRLRNPLYTQQLRADASLASTHNKAFIVGEFGLASVDVYKRLLDEVVEGKMAAGALLWSLRFHSRDGGFYTHGELDGYYAYHHPGFPPTHPGFAPDEQSVASLIRSYAAKVNPATIPATIPATVPRPPTLLNTTSTSLR
ncbi:hypothetical protein HK104_005506, partial [Borealophlyctis nickersoniae]